MLSGIAESNLTNMFVRADLFSCPDGSTGDGYSLCSIHPASSDAPAKVAYVLLMPMDYESACECLLYLDDCGCES